jgi:hypothetical protein
MTVSVTGLRATKTSSAPATLARVPRLAFAASCLLAALVAVSAAFAGDIQPVRVVDGGKPETQLFSPEVSVMIESPGPYVAASPGTWTGPSFATGGQENAPAGTTRIEWTVAFRDRAADAAAAAAAANANNWPVDQKFGLSVPLYVAGRFVGTLPAYAVITQAGGAQKARFEATAAIPLGAGAQALVHFLTPAPNADDYFVGGMLASTWNRGEVLQALTLIRVEGNLAPKTVSIRVDRAAQSVRGKVVDPFYNPLVGVPVVEQRWNGRAWRATRVGRTANDGSYRIAAGKGRFRTVVTVNGISLTSAEVSI